jgi:hypothetical protein
VGVVDRANETPALEEANPERERLRAILLARRRREGLPDGQM